MLTPHELAALLRSCNVKRIAQASGLSTKTIYRLRAGLHSPTMRTVAAILNAIEGKQCNPS